PIQRHVYFVAVEPQQHGRVVGAIGAVIHHQNPDPWAGRPGHQIALVTEDRATSHRTRLCGLPWQGGGPKIRTLDLEFGNYRSPPPCQRIGNQIETGAKSMPYTGHKKKTCAKRTVVFCSESPGWQKRPGKPRPTLPADSFRLGLPGRYGPTAPAPRL